MSLGILRVQEKAKAIYPLASVPSRIQSCFQDSNSSVLFVCLFVCLFILCGAGNQKQDLKHAGKILTIEPHSQLCHTPSVLPVQESQAMGTSRQCSQQDMVVLGLRGTLRA